MTDKLNRIFVDNTIDKLEKSRGNKPEREEWFLDQGLDGYTYLE